MAYEIEIYPIAANQIKALPRDAVGVADAMAVLALVPWNGEPYNEEKPDGAMRQLVFGEGKGFVTDLILEDQRRVDVLRVVWVG